MTALLYARRLFTLYGFMPGRRRVPRESLAEMLKILKRLAAKIPKLGLALLVCALLTFSFAIVGAQREVASESIPYLGTGASAQERGAAAFVGESFGGISQHALESNAISWKLAAAALVLSERKHDPRAEPTLDTLRTVLRRFGFLYPNTAEGLPGTITIEVTSKPLGMTHGTIAPIGGSKVEVANLGCASCHAGVAYDAQGNPDPARAVPGMPNTSLDLESYTQAIFLAMREHSDGDALLEMADTLFPEMDWRERASLRWLVLPLARGRLEELAGRETALPFPNGLPGATNGVAALKLQTGTALLGGGFQDRGFVSIPDLALRHRRSRLLADGAYSTPSGTTAPSELAAITSFFTVPSMGVSAEKAREYIPQARAIFAWLADYRPPPFPGQLDRAKARRGAGIYATQCAACHGKFEWSGARPKLATFPDWVGDVGTDSLRAQVFDSALAEAVRASSYGDMIRVSIGEGYAAPPLAGLWASAPYLHNSSVPTLAALLYPRQRPRRFAVGGHALDWNAVGLRLADDGGYPDGYVPFSTPQWVDTSKPGLGNKGHEFGSDLSEAERAALIEFLKLL